MGPHFFASRRNILLIWQNIFKRIPEVRVETKIFVFAENFLAKTDENSGNFREIFRENAKYLLFSPHIF
jgi:hypothetical protein